MGSRGPLPYSGSRLKRHGEKHADRRKPRQRSGGGLQQPRGLSPAAATEWKRIVPVLQETARVGASDQTTLECYCEAVALMRQARRELTRGGAMVTTAQGVKQNPAYLVWRGAVEVVHKFALQFGLTSAARMRLEEPTLDDTEDDKDRFIKLA